MCLDTNPPEHLAGVRERRRGPDQGKASTTCFRQEPPLRFTWPAESLPEAADADARSVVRSPNDRDAVPVEVSDATVAGEAGQRGPAREQTAARRRSPRVRVAAQGQGFADPIRRRQEKPRGLQARYRHGLISRCCDDRRGTRASQQARGARRKAFEARFPLRHRAARRSSWLMASARTRGGRRPRRRVRRPTVPAP